MSSKMTAARRGRGLGRLVTRCCGKRRYATRQAAEAAMARITAVSDRATVPVRAYQGECGWWHLTSTTTPPPHAAATTGKEAPA